MGESTNRKAQPGIAGRHYGGTSVDRNQLIQLSPIKVKIVLVVCECLRYRYLKILRVGVYTIDIFILCVQYIVNYV